MRITHAGLRSNLPTTSFAVRPSSRREPHLGLRRRLGPQITASPLSRARVPLLQTLRSSTPDISASGRISLLHRSDSISWTRRADSQAYRPRPRSATPWRA